MAWFSGKVSLGNFPDFAGAVNKLSESVKNIEKNFDTALGLEEKADAATGISAEGVWPSASDRNALFQPIIGFMGQKSGDSIVESMEKPDSSRPTSPIKEKEVNNASSSTYPSKQIAPTVEANEEVKEADRDGESEEGMKNADGEQTHSASAARSEPEVISPGIPDEVSEQRPWQVETAVSVNNLQEEKKPEAGFPTSLESIEPEPMNAVIQVEVIASALAIDDTTGSQGRTDEQREDGTEIMEVFPSQTPIVSPGSPDERRKSSASNSLHKTGEAEDNFTVTLPIVQHNDVEVSEAVVDLVSHQSDNIDKSVDRNPQANKDASIEEQDSRTKRNFSSVAEPAAELENLKKEMKMMETALQGAARQAQAKADEIAKLMNENEQLKAIIDDLRKNTNEAEIESLREEYHQRVAALERKVYALTKERDTLRREQNKKNDAAALLKEKDEIINQVMAEGEELSKKQAAQESQIRKLRAQIRELEEEKKGLLTKLQVEENKAESIKRDKAATEKLFQETVEKHQVELTTQKEYYTNALIAAKEAEALVEARANTEARTELENRLREVEDRETMLVQTLEELRQTLSRKEQQAVFREDMLRRDIEDLQKRYQASERRCEELITQVPESTRPLLRQIEAMQETSARRAEAWAAVERSLNSRLQESEVKAAAAEEKERSINERLSQTLSRINVLEAQISCLRAEQTQLTRSLDKERHKAAENRQEYLALKEEADTHESRVNQLEGEIRELRRKHEVELHEALMRQELLQQELEREKAARQDQERATRLQSATAHDQSPITRQKYHGHENGKLTPKLSSASSLSSMEESYVLQTTLDSSENLSEHRSAVEGTKSPFYMKSMTSSTFEAALRQKEGELASYMSRLASMESIRDSLAEELVKLTAECEKLRAEAAMLPGIRSELEALRRRHSAALELMGERDEELEELRADIVDLKEMYREQVNMLVNKINTLSSSIGAAS